MPIPQCPRCASVRITSLNTGRKAGGAIGTLAGAAIGLPRVMTAAATGSRVGASFGLLAGPAGIATGSIAGGIIGALIGGASGCITGTALGELLDQNVLDNYRCLDCRHSFSHDMPD